MDTFQKVMDIVQDGVTAFGTVWIAWGLFILGTGLKDKTAPEIKQGFGHIIGGAMVILGAVLIGTIAL